MKFNEGELSFLSTNYIGITDEDNYLRTTLQHKLKRSCQATYPRCACRVAREVCTGHSCACLGIFSS
ncbi:hypothetical protein PVC01_130030000 [Plasmodium vivax]|uniref:(malaria parasite P. vivax) hypothetical protein n=1 Tax=Plasmodium vivax TaxID=5855 RepID=A0A1G4H399_PLAVI|nr:unnamed protein product [Plasmodium vivax]CAI7722881.1 hypothetical protein PVPAM_130038300 [Plasmodium vivax]SCO69338.1 hypothetical protein PVT01_130028100 [Plasmodium vivax]SCO74814.1 hypothetical protein PVC01_130030000 [Plasmodium vivax]